jgi:hypothetical protein
MIILDENIVGSQRQLLRSWRISIRQIGFVGYFVTQNSTPNLKGWERCCVSLVQEFQFGISMRGKKHSTSGSRYLTVTASAYK